MLFSLSIIEGWSTASINFKNAFTQTTLPNPVFLDLPLGYVQANPGAKDKVMKIKKSLDCDCRAANLWHCMLHKSLIEDMGFKCSELDPCLFLKNNCNVVLCVDDTIIFSKDNAEIEHVLQQFCNLQCDFSRNKTFLLYLGIQLQNLANGCIKLSKPHLKSSAIDVMGLSDANPCTTLIASPLFKHMDSLPFDQSFNYQSALGIFQCIGNNTHPECASAIALVVVKALAKLTETP